jgi:hypothetical protein
MVCLFSFFHIFHNRGPTGATWALFARCFTVFIVEREREREGEGGKEGGRGGMLKLAGFAISILMSESLNLNAPLQDWWN